MSNISNGTDGNVSLWTDHEPVDGAVAKRHAKPSFWWKLESSADEIANNVGVADNDLE